MKRSRLRVLDMMMVIGIPKAKILGDEVGPLKEYICDDFNTSKGSLLPLRNQERLALDLGFYE